MPKFYPSAPAGVTTFTGLTDTPSTYTGHAGKHLKVNSAENAVEFALPTFLELDDTPSSFTGQAGKYVRVDSLESALEFTTPPAGITTGWELHKTGTFTADVTISALDGDTDKLWMLIVRSRHTTGHDLTLRFNGDSTASYSIYGYFHGVAGGVASSGSFGGSGQTWITFERYTRNEHQVACFIVPSSGQARLLNFYGWDFTDVNNENFFVAGGRWYNTTANITSINLIVGTITAGEYWLFRRV